MKFRFVAVAGVLVLSGCAVTPESVAPAYVSEVPYDSYSCGQLGQEEQRINEAMSVAYKQQNDARTGDTWGVILLGLPTSSMSGGNVAPQIADLKGQLNAVHQAEIKKNCAVAAR